MEKIYEMHLYSTQTYGSGVDAISKGDTKVLKIKESEKNDPNLIDSLIHAIDSLHGTKTAYRLVEVPMNYYLCDLTFRKSNNRFEITTIKCIYKGYDEPLHLREELEKTLSENTVVDISFTPISEDLALNATGNSLIEYFDHMEFNF